MIYYLQDILKNYRNDIYIYKNDMDRGDNVINLYTQLGYQFDQFDI